MRLSSVVSRSFLTRPAAISSQEFSSRRGKLLQLARNESPATSTAKLAAILKGAQRTAYAPDVFYPFRQSSYFRYLTGVNVADSLLFVSERESVLGIREVDNHTALWDGCRFSPSDLERISGVDRVLSLKEFESYVAANIGDKEMLMELDDFKESPMLELFVRRPQRQLRTLLDRVRWRKSAAEIGLMQATCQIGSAAMNSMISQSRWTPNEGHISGLLEYEYRRRGATGAAYPPVVAAGSRANTIHYIDADQDISPGDCVLVDAGCEIEGYVSDISRSFPIDGKFSEPQRTLYEALEHVHEDCLYYVRNVRPLKLNELYFHMLRSMAARLREAHVFPASISQDAALTLSDELCPHHVSHYLGMDVHDTFSVSRSIEIPPDVVITVEPGVYVRNGMSHIRSEFHGIGYRIEDDVLITKTGSELLTASCVRHADEIEKVMNV